MGIWQPVSRGDAVLVLPASGDTAVLGWILFSLGVASRVHVIDLFRQNTIAYVLARTKEGT
jgi:hypothetical protein